MFGGHFKQLNQQPKAPKCEKRGTKQTKKKPLGYSVRAETRRQRIALVHLSWEQARRTTQIFHLLCTSVNDWESTRCADLGVTKKFWQVDEFTNMACGNENQLYREILVKIIAHLFTLYPEVSLMGLILQVQPDISKIIHLGGF